MATRIASALLREPPGEIRAARPWTASAFAARLDGWSRLRLTSPPVQGEGAAIAPTPSDREARHENFRLVSGSARRSPRAGPAGGAGARRRQIGRHLSGERENAHPPT